MFEERSKGKSAVFWFLNNFFNFAYLGICACECNKRSQVPGLSSFIHNFNKKGNIQNLVALKTFSYLKKSKKLLRFRNFQCKNDINVSFYYFKMILRKYMILRVTLTMAVISRFLNYTK